MAARIPIAVAALVRDGQVLLVHRHPLRPAYPDCWDLVGGHIDSGESPSEAVSRECREELGVDIQDPRPMPMTISDPALDLHAFLVTRWEGEPVNAAPDEHDDLRWFRPRDLAGVRLAHAASLASIVSAVQAATDRPTYAHEMTTEPGEQQIDVRNNPESESAAADRPSIVARAADNGPPPQDAPPAGTPLVPAEGGTAGDDPLAGVTISDEDKEDAVSGDTGPTGSDGPGLGPSSR